MLKSLIKFSACAANGDGGKLMDFSVETTPAGAMLIGQFAMTVTLDRKAADKLASALELAAEKLRRA